MNKFVIEYNNIEYEIQVEKLLFVLKILENNEIKDKSKENLLKLIEKFDLYDEIFLAEMSK